MLFLIYFFSLISASFAICPPESLEFQGFCYIFKSEAIQYPVAEVDCNSLSGHLVSIHDGFVNALLTSEASTYFNDSTITEFWIGLNNLTTPGDWSWTDNSTFDFNEIILITDNENVTTNDCAALMIKNGRWMTDYCFNKKPYVCKVSSLPPPTCAYGWFYFPSTLSCYGIDKNYGRLNWTSAEEICKSLKGHLPSIHSFEEAKFISSFGIIRGKDQELIGLNSDDNLTWKWSDGSPNGYLPWLSNQHNPINGSCALIFSGKISNIPCDNSLQFICKKLA